VFQKKQNGPAYRGLTGIYWIVILGHRLGELNDFNVAEYPFHALA
jgi:hypothetical protein